jgi:hypothetical protein
MADAETELIQNLSSGTVRGRTASYPCREQGHTAMMAPASNKFIQFLHSLVTGLSAIKFLIKSQR